MLAANCRYGASSNQSRPQDETESLPLEVATLLECPPDGSDETAWTAFVQRFSQILLAVAFGFGPGYDEAMDRYAFLLDELRRGDYRRLRGFSAVGTARFTTWLVVVSRRLCVDHHRSCYGRSRKSTNDTARLIRRRLRQSDHTPDDIASLPDARQIDAGEALVDAERGLAIHRALSRLPPGDLRLLELRFRDELPARQIAGILSLPTPFHVYRRLRAVCGALREDLEQAGVGRGHGE